MKLIKKKNGNKEQFNTEKIKKFLEIKSKNLKYINIDEIISELNGQLYDGINTLELQKVLLMVSKSKIQEEPDYSYLAARILLDSIYKEALGSKNFNDELYREKFIANIKELVDAGRLTDKVLAVDLKRLANFIKPERDLLFKYHGLQIVYDRYLLHIENKRMETPQQFFMRVAIGISLGEKNVEEWAEKFYEEFSQFNYLPSSPTLFNSCTLHPQLSSCYLSTFDDSIDGIFGGIHQQALLSKWAGGLGMSVSSIRAIGAWIKGTNGPSQGLIPWLKCINDMLLAVNQGSKRKGSGVVYLEPWHLEIESFLDLRKSTGDDRLRCHDTHTALWCSDLFFNKIEEDDDWYLFSPDETPELPETYGKEFEDLYHSYVKKAEAGKLRQFKKMKAKALWKKILVAVKETGHPWICFKDTSNERYNDIHEGIVHSSNLCCMTKDQLVVTDKGLLTVEELYKLQSPVMVMGREKEEKASNMMLPRPNAEIVKIHTKEGYTHKVTPDHKVWVRNVGWVETQHLKKEDEILIQQKEGLFGKEHHPELAFIVGLWAGDGTCGKNNVCLDIWPEQFPFIAEIEHRVRFVLSNYEWGQHTHSKDISEVQFNYTKTKDKARLNSGPLRRVFDSFNVKKHNKLIVPDFIRFGDKETVAAYLEGLYFADGTVQGGEVTVSSLCSVNKKLLDEIQVILANFGVKSSVTLSQEERDVLMPDGHGGQKQYCCQPTYRLFVTSIQGNKIIEENLHISRYRNNSQPWLENLKKDGYQQKMYAVFDRLEVMPNEDAYCLSVYSDEHSWTVNGLITKNTEIMRHTKASKIKEQNIISIGEVAVCNLASVNLKNFVKGKEICWNDLAKVVRVAIRGLDNVIDVNYYPVKEAANSNLKHRPIGLGQMGFHDMLHELGIDYSSDAAIELSDAINEFISFHALDETYRLGQEKGVYPTFQGSLLSNGMIPKYTFSKKGELETEKTSRSSYSQISLEQWQQLSNNVKDGVRNSNVMAIAPTATISYISGCSQSIEPDYSVLFSYSTLSGDFIMINEYFIDQCKEAGVWNKELLEQVKINNGNISSLKNIPKKIREQFRTAMDMDQKHLIKCASARQKWIDMGQSLNIYYNKSSMKELSDIYLYAWKNGLKSTYYLRTEGASKSEKTSVAVEKTKTCKVGEPCESCQ